MAGLKENSPFSSASIITRRQATGTKCILLFLETIPGMGTSII